MSWPASEKKGWGIVECLELTFLQKAEVCVGPDNGNSRALNPKP